MGLRVGIVGTGFVGMGLAVLLAAMPAFTLSRVLTRRPLNSFKVHEGIHLTLSLDELIDKSDIIVECSGDIEQGCRAVEAAFAAGLPVVTMGAEFHTTVGSYYAQRGYITEAEGDQPGSLAALREEAISMGFNPLVLGNIKGYLNHHPTPQDMAHWSRVNGISIPQVTSFTDGTKLQIEAAFVANGLGASIAQQGLLGPKDVTLQEAGNLMGAQARRQGVALSDYVLNRNLPAGVFVTAEHAEETAPALKYLKMGDGPYYNLFRPYHLCHLEAPRTIARVRAGGPVLLNNSVNPTINVVAVAKKDLPAGHIIDRAIGGWDVRGEAKTFAESGTAPAIGLLDGAVLRHSVSAGQIITAADVDIPDSLTKTAWAHVLTAAKVTS